MTGLGLHYSLDGLINCGSNRVVDGPLYPAPGAAYAIAGHRAPEVWLNKPGTFDRIRLYQIMQNIGKIWVIVFAGRALSRPSAAADWNTIGDDERRHKLMQLQALNNWNMKRFYRTLQFITIIAGGPELSVDEALGGMMPWGSAYFDMDSSAHLRYGFDPLKGGVVIVRPDGVLGSVLALSSMTEIEAYFWSFAMEDED
ncbi:MAG: hypothetical protein Q9209_003494 [Squamulea sp. 1 TL-2023]